MKISLALVALASLTWSATASADDAEPAPASVPPRSVSIEYTQPAPSSAPAPATADRPANVPPAGTPRYDLWRIGIGPRFDYIASTGFDTFADSNLLGSLALDATYPVLTRGRLAVGVGLGWAAGSRSDGFRGATSRVAIQRLQVPIEGRYHFVPGVFGFAKVAPGATAMAASLKEASSPNTLSDTAWTFSADASLGAGILLGPRNYTAQGGTGPDADREKRAFRIWAVPEIGYAFTTSASFDLRPGRESKDALGTDERTAISSLAANAFFWRLSLAATF